MADLERIKEDIADIGRRPKAVTFDEIKRIADQLKLVGWSVNYRKATETWIFYIEGQKFNVCEHNRGSSQLKVPYVTKFLHAMINLGLYED